MLVAARNGAWAKSGGGLPTARDYVQDGLVAMWDGIENAGWGVHDPSATTWKDLIGSNDALLSGALVPDRCWGNNHFYNNIESVVFTGTPSSAMKAAITSGRLTVQGLFMPEVRPSSSNMCIFQCSPASVTTDGMIFGVTNNSSFASGNTMSWATNRAVNKLSPPGWEYIVGNTYALSFICDNTTMTSILNGSSVTATRTKSLPVDSDLTSFAIFNYNWNAGRSRTLRGKVYNLRLYSRALTAEEIAANYAIDKARFNLP